MDYFLDKQVFMNILQYEEQILQGLFDKENVEKLIHLYAECVEYYDSLRDPIKFYFLEKMQIILSNEQTLKKIITPRNTKYPKKVNQQNISLKQQAKNIIIDNFDDEEIERQQSGDLQDRQETNFSDILENGSDVYNNDLNLDYGDEESDYQDIDSVYEDDYDPKNEVSNKENRLTMQQMKLKYRQNYKQVKYSISKKRIERSKRVGMYIQMQEEQNINQINAMGSLYQNYVDSNQKQANTVKQDLILQQQDFERKLQKRRTLKEGQNNLISEKTLKSRIHQQPSRKNSFNTNRDSLNTNKDILNTNKEYIKQQLENRTQIV